MRDFGAVLLTNLTITDNFIGV